MNRTFTRKLDALHHTHVAEAELDPETMSPRDRDIRYWKKWDLCVATPDGDKRAHDLSEEDWAQVVHCSSPNEWGMTFHMPNTPTLAEKQAKLLSAIEPAAAAVATQPVPPQPTPPPIAPVQTSPVPWPPPIALAGELCRWVPRHEADAMRAQDMRDYQRRLAEQERRRYLGWD